MSSGRRILFAILFLAVAFGVTMGCVATGAYIRQGHVVTVGEPSNQRIKATMTIENRVATERNRQAAADAAERLDPITIRVEEATDELYARLDEFFAEADELRKKQVDIFTPYSNPTSAADDVPVPTIDGEPVPLPTPTPTPAPAPKLPGLTENTTASLLAMDSERYAAFVEAVYGVSGIIMEIGVQELDAKTLLSVRDEMDKLDLNSDARSLGYEIISAYLRPNIIVDEQATLLAREERAARYDPVWYLQGETIVDDGQIISEEAYAALEDLGMLKSNLTENYVQLVGAAVLVIVLMAVTVFYLRYYKERPMDIKESALLLTLYVIMILSARAMISMPIQLLPLTVFVILAAAFLGVRAALVLNLGVTVSCYMILDADITFLLYYITSGAAVAVLAGKTTDRSRIFLSALLTSAVNLCLFIAVDLLLHKQFTAEIMFGSAFAALAGMLSVIISFGSMPLWEAAFGLVTPIKLLDLTNPDSKLLRRLAIEAPGTYHHSVIVANLAETAAYDIGASTSISRTGGYYHDIGKLKYPQYFVENMVGTNPHDDMDAFSSVQVIMSHVSYGRELAQANKLPKVVQDIIFQHHGTTLLRYFYHKARGESVSENLDESEYRYPNEIPQSKEAAVVMLADTVEAAVRSMIPTGKTMDEVSKFITDLVREKLDDGQLRDSTLTIRDLDTVVKSFMRVFRGMYHERIPYPVAEKEKAAAPATATEA